MALNLSRNTKVWFTSNVSPITGVLTDATTGFSAFTAANTFELQVLDGYTFTQGSNQQTITLTEAGTNPVRGQRSFNTALNPVDFSFSTYIRPAGSTSGTITAIEKCLWNALASSQAIDSTEYTLVAAGSTATRASATASAITNLILTGVSTGLAVGDAINVSGMGDATWDSTAAGAIVITSLVAATNTTIGGVYAKAPTGATTSVNSASSRWTKGAWVEKAAATSARASFMGSNKHQLQKFALIFLVDNVYYFVNNASLNQATIDFGLDAISAISWSGNGTTIVQSTAFTAASQVSLITSTPFSSSANYITNKLSTLTLQSKIGGVAGTTYVLPITGGSITINNNITYVTPENLGVVNYPIGYFTGTRSITGTLNAYLRTGTSTESGGLLNAILADAAAGNAETKYKLQIEIGGISNSVRVEMEMPGVSVQVPTVDVADVVSTTINFTAQGHDAYQTANTFDLTQVNDMTVRYFSA